MKVNQRIYLLLIASGVLTGLAGCGEEQQAAAPAQQAMPVGVVTLQSQQVTLTKELPGRIAASQIAEIRPQVSGIVQSRLFVEGSQVKAGDALYQIDPATFEAAVGSAKASVARAEAGIASSKAKIARYKELLKTNAVSEQDYDEADAAYKQAKADLLTAQAQLRTAQINLDYSKVTSPIDGQISKSAVTVGALVSANQNTALTTVTQLDPVYVDLTQSSTELLELKRALASGAIDSDKAAQTMVELTLEDGSVYSHKGTLQFSDVTVDQGTGSVTLRAEFPNPEKILLPGMYVRATVVEGIKENAILAPQRGISRNTKGQATAMVVNKEGKVEPRILEADRTIGTNWLIKSGLSAGDQLIVEGLQKVRPGAAVTATPAESNSANAQ
ncbi:efflux RND transporter periplasmic adaptor subunit [Neptunicella marina]|uniref:Efflux RND transporter periplasmic adaptor subunit n=1 Tax=Neptunicella marina TaxID=2125989 RepID=A0A8J6IV20_9ALTE|nr:efflux RND transporter periplasmic adaptor subunit [Neptunicella marina]MBC3766136.1 efflux RND transporter periplasmic adaptor subunit [Neptunicella marina]